jgi:NADPH2:quinone reductase
MRLPETMTYIDARGAGGPEVLVPATAPLPEPRLDEVLIRVLAAGVNRPDVAQRKGIYPPPPGASPVLGLEVAGEVVALGPHASGWSIGDRVCALANGGGYAEYCLAPGPQCLPWPTGFDAIHAAAVPETYFTVWANLFQLGRLGAEETALVHGGSSGIGVTAIQLAHEFGARVYATAGSQAKCDACLRLGAAAAINYHETDFAAAIAEFTGGRGVDVVLDMVGAPYLERNLKSLALDGRLVVIAVQGGAVAEKLNLAQLMMRRQAITGSTMRPRTTAQKGAIAAELRARVWPLLSEGRCGPVIHAVFPLAEAAQAHALMEDGRHIGKIMLEVAAG